MSTSMSFDRAVYIACKTLMSAGNFTQDERAAAYDTLVSVNAQFQQTFESMFPQIAAVEPKVNDTLSKLEEELVN